MKESILGQILALKDLPTKELQEKYQALFDGKKAPSSNRVYLWKKIAYRIQELEYGSISQDVQNRIKELKEEYDPINNKAIRPEKSSDAKPNQYRSIRDRRLPIPGTIIKKEYKGTIIQVKVLEKSFEYNGKIYKSLTAVAKEVTGMHWNGYLFFNL